MRADRFQVVESFAGSRYRLIATSRSAIGRYTTQFVQMPTDSIVFERTVVLDRPVNGLWAKAKTLIRWPGVTSGVSGVDAVAMEMSIQPDNRTDFTGDYVGFGAILGLVIIRLAQHGSPARQLLSCRRLTRGAAALARCE